MRWVATTCSTCGFPRHPEWYERLWCHLFGYPFWLTGRAPGEGGRNR